MKLTNLSVLALSASVINARFIERTEQDQVVLSAAIPAAEERFLLDLGPGQDRAIWVTEEEKWDLRRVGRPNLEMKHKLILCRPGRISWTSQRRRSLALVYSVLPR